MTLTEPVTLSSPAKAGSRWNLIEQNDTPKESFKFVLTPDFVEIIFPETGKVIIRRNHILPIMEGCKHHINQYGAVDFLGREIADNG